MGAKISADIGAPSRSVPEENEPYAIMIRGMGGMKKDVLDGEKGAVLSDDPTPKMKHGDPSPQADALVALLEQSDLWTRSYTARQRAEIDRLLAKIEKLEAEIIDLRARQAGLGWFIISKAWRLTRPFRQMLIARGLIKLKRFRQP